MRVLHKLYRENDRAIMTASRLDDETFAAAIQSMVEVCTDAVIINRTRRSVYLAQRIQRPMRGPWVIGGRRRAGESSHASIKRCFERETGLIITEDRFTFVTEVEFIWLDREQTPQDFGLHSLSHVFMVELNQGELGKATNNLEHTFDLEFGLKEFGIDDLRRANVHPFLLDLYAAIY